MIHCAIFAIPVRKASLRNGYVIYENRILPGSFLSSRKKTELKRAIILEKPTRSDTAAGKGGFYLT